MSKAAGILLLLSPSLRSRTFAVSASAFAFAFFADPDFCSLFLRIRMRIGYPDEVWLFLLGHSGNVWLFLVSWIGPRFGLILDWFAIWLTSNFEDFVMCGQPCAFVTCWEVSFHFPQSLILSPALWSVAYG